MCYLFIFAFSLWQRSLIKDLQILGEHQLLKEAWETINILQGIFVISIMLSEIMRRLCCFRNMFQIGFINVFSLSYAGMKGR